MACNQLSDIALTTLEAVADSIGVTIGEDPAQDRLIARYINAASAQFQADIGYRIAYDSNVVEKVSQTWGNAVLTITNVLPLDSISEIKLDDNVIPDTAYSIESAKLGWIKSTTSTWPSTEYYMMGLVDSVTPVGKTLDYTVTYSGGYVTPAQAEQTGQDRTLPYDIEDAIIESCVAKYHKQGYDPTVSGVRTGEWSITFQGGKAGSVPQSYQDAVQRYKRHIIVVT